MWETIFDADFAAEFAGFEEVVREAILEKALLLRQFGPSLGRPHVDTLKGSHLSNLKELRMEPRGEPWRVLFLFDPQRRAILLVGGNKATDKRWYKKTIRIAEARYAQRLEEGR